MSRPSSTNIFTAIVETMGGKICVLGICDRGIPEKITMKMDYTTFDHFVQVLQSSIKQNWIWIQEHCVK